MHRLQCLRQHLSDRHRRPRWTADGLHPLWRVEADVEATAADLARALSARGWGAHEFDASTMAGTGEDRAGRDLLMRMGVAGFAMMNLMLLSVAAWSGAAVATRTCSTGSPPASRPR